MSTVRDTPLPKTGKAVGIDTLGMTMRFGSFTALDNVSLAVPAGSFHALLGENGAGKSTLVKCIMGFYHATSGSLSVDGREVAVASPKDAATYGLGMVYQHFTLVPSLTGAENLVISRTEVPAVINWASGRWRAAISPARSGASEVGEYCDRSMSHCCTIHWIMPTRPMRWPSSGLKMRVTP